MMGQLTKKEIARMLAADDFATEQERQLANYAYEMWARVKTLNELSSHCIQQGERLMRIIRQTNEHKDWLECVQALKSQQMQFEILERQRREILNIL